MARISNAWPAIASLWQAPASAWLSPRRKRFWLVVGVLLYTAVGFGVAPWILKNQLQSQLSVMLDRPVSVSAVRINPYVLSVEVEGFAIDETDGSRAIAFQRLFVNFQTSSLFRRALTFSEFSLESPYVQFIRFADGSNSLGALLPVAKDSDSEADADTEGGLLRLIVENLSLTDGHATVEDRSHLTPFIQEIRPIELAVAGFSTLPDVEGEQKVTIETPAGAHLEWSGRLRINPLSLSGSVIGSGPYLPMLYRWTQDRVSFQVTEGEAEMAFDYLLDFSTPGEPRVVIDEVDFNLSKLAMVDAGGVRFLELPDNRLTGGHFAWPERTLGAERLEISGAHLLAWRDEAGILSLTQLVPQDDISETDVEVPTEVDAETYVETDEEADVNVDDAAVTPFDDWAMSLGELAIVDFAAGFSDRTLPAFMEHTPNLPGRANVLPHDQGVGAIETLKAPVQIEIAEFDATIADLSNTSGDRFGLSGALRLESGGIVKFDGDFGILPAPAFAAQVSVDDLALGDAQPYLDQMMRVRIDGGVVDAQVKIEHSPQSPLGIRGNASIESLSVSDADKGERLVGWEQVAVEAFAIDPLAPSAEIAKVTVEAPFARLLIDTDGTTNFQQLVITDEASDEETAEGAGTATPVNITVIEIQVKDGTLDFTDRGLPLPFAASVSQFGGQMSTLSTTSSEPASFKFSGQVADYGLARVEGRLKVLEAMDDTDVRIAFKNVAMPDLDPYTIKFAGRRIDDGRLNLDLRYQLEAGKIVGENDIVIDRLTLGEKVEQPGAMDLPLGLAVALLKGPDGKISVDIPVTGDVDDPSFDLGSTIAGAFGNIIASIVSSPFRMLAGLVGADAEDFSRLEFEPGQAALTAPEQEKINKLAEALALRPGLGLTLAGSVDKRSDGQALAEANVDARLAEQLEIAAGADDDAQARTRQRRRALESMVSLALPDLDLAEVRATHQRPEDPASPGGKTTLDEPAYLASLRRLLIESEPIGDEALGTLAAARSEAVRAALLPLGVASSRIVTEPRVDVEATKDWVPMELRVGKL